MPEQVPIFTRSLFEFQSQFCRPFGVCYCGTTGATYVVSKDQFWVPNGKIQMEGRCRMCEREWKEIINCLPLESEAMRCMCSPDEAGARIAHRNMGFQS